MNEQQNNSPRQTAVDALISGAKTGWGYYSTRDAVSNYMESCGTNRPSIGGEDTILAHRKIAANRLAIDCIYALSKEELSEGDRELEGLLATCRGAMLGWECSHHRQAFSLHLSTNI